jgi:protein-S-isoprenylcysteine O-methyltransferase Ste14
MARLLRGLDIAIVLGFAADALVAAPRESNWYAGLSVTAVCTPFWIAARWQLGPSFSVRPEARHLVTSGLYSRLRHPVYVFGTPAVMGVLVALLGWGALAIAVIVVPVEIVRSRREEAVLAERFGPEYEAYRKRTWF